MKKIAVVTVARSDYGILRPLLRRLSVEPGFELQVIAAGMHLATEFGHTIDEIRDDGFPIAATVEMMPAGDKPADIARAMGFGTAGYADAYERLQPDLLILLGDRFEMHAAAVAATPFLIPIAHISGGAVTEGAIDDNFRHSLTKFSHVHFVENQLHAARVRQMGEPAQRVHLTGALGIDSALETDWLSIAELNQRFGLALDPAKPPLLVTFHPVTREFQNTRAHGEALMAALESAGLPVVFTYPNADTAGRELIAMIEQFVRHHQKPHPQQAWAVPSFGSQGYFSMMRHASAMVGNSSSGIIEAASLRLPVVDIGSRQKGRPAGVNVVRVDCEASAILNAIHQVTDTAWRQRLQGLVNPYGDGHAAPQIMATLRALDLKDPSLIRKPFYSVGNDAGEIAAPNSPRRRRP
jgi:UDP-N-acetylglucosamine 2-epimerase (non-hydrolysing)/GDP/UDP-N,N'-diacetylbacillosamine 2-epimerase (hydrolysing)